MLIECTSPPPPYPVLSESCPHTRGKGIREGSGFQTEKASGAPALGSHQNSTVSPERGECRSSFWVRIPFPEMLQHGSICTLTKAPGLKRHGGRVRRHISTSLPSPRHATAQDWDFSGPDLCCELARQAKVRSECTIAPTTDFRIGAIHKVYSLAFASEIFGEGNIYTLSPVSVLSPCVQGKPL